jgi:ribosome-associated protein
MLEVIHTIRIPLAEFRWSFARAGGPGGQNVNKVASKAVLRWNAKSTPSLPEEVKIRFLAHYRRRVTAEGDFIVTSQKFRDQERNRRDCLEKLAALLRQVATPPKERTATKPTRAARQRRLAGKRHRARMKQTRRPPGEE